MIETYEVHQLKCDACGTTKEEPLAISGAYDSGWHNISGKDLCRVCYGLFCFKMIDHLQNTDELDEMIENHVENSKKVTSFDFDTTLIRG